MDALTKNIEAARRANAALAGRAERYSGQRVLIEAARSAEPTFRHRGMLFHSAYDPKKEAAVQASEVLERKPDWVLLFGLGCAHLAQALAAKGMTDVLVYEPSMEILSGVLAACDLSALLSRGAVYDDLGAFMSRVRDIDGFKNIVSYATSPYKSAFPKEFVEFTNKVSNAHISSHVYIKTDIDSRDVWVNNYFENIRHFPYCAPVDSLKGAFRGVPMIIAGAGPSLGKNAHLLREAKGRAVIVAAITAYKPLLGYGVVPDFVIAAEKVDLPEYFTYGEDDLKTRLIIGDVAHPGMFSRQVRDKLVFFSSHTSLGAEHARHWGSEYFPQMGGSVTTAALDIGVMLGCDPVVFVGQDLCFGDGQTHVPGGVYISQEVRIDRHSGSVEIEEDYVTLSAKARSSFKLLWLKGLDGSPVPSKYDWVTFHQWFENYMADMKASGNPTRVLNATEGGAYIEGMEHLPLRQAIDMHMKKDAGIDETIRAALAGRKEPDLAGLIRSFESMHKGLKEMRRTADAIVGEIARIRAAVAGGRVGADDLKRAGRIKRLEDRLFKDAESSPFIWESLAASTYKLKERLRDVGSAPGEGSVEDDMSASAAAYTDVSNACGRYLPVVWRSIRDLKAICAAGGAKKAAMQ